MKNTFKLENIFFSLAVIFIALPFILVNILPMLNSMEISSVWVLIEDVIYASVIVLVGITSFRKKKSPFFAIMLIIFGIHISDIIWLLRRSLIYDYTFSLSYYTIGLILTGIVNIVFGIIMLCRNSLNKKMIIIASFNIIAMMFLCLILFGRIEPMLGYIMENESLFYIFTNYGFMGQVGFLMFFAIYLVKAIKGKKYSGDKLIDLLAEQSLTFLKEQYEMGMMSEKEYMSIRQTIINNL